MQPTTHYQVLRVAEDAPQAVIAAAHHALSQEVNREWRMGGDGQAAVANIRALETAFVALSDPEQRAAYDELLQHQRGRVPVARAQAEATGDFAGRQAPVADHGAAQPAAADRRGSARTLAWIGGALGVIAILALAVVGVAELLRPKASPSSHPDPESPPSGLSQTVSARGGLSGSGSQNGRVLAAGDWRTREVSGLSLELPEDLAPRPRWFEPSELALESIDKEESNGLHFNGVDVSLQYAESATADADIDHAVRDAIAAMESTPGRTGFKTEVTSVTRDGAAGRLIKATYNQLWAEMESRCLVLAQDGRLWHLRITGAPDDASALADRILPSVRVKRDLAPISSPIAAAPHAEEGWMRRDVAGISLVLPGEARRHQFELPEAAKTPLIKQLEIFRLGIGEAEVTVNHAEYLVDANLDGAVQGSLDSLKAESGVASVESKTKRITYEGLPARRVTATFTRSGHALAVHSFVVARGHRLWAVIVAGRPAEAAKLADRIFETIQLRPEPAPVASTMPLVEDWKRRDLGELSLELPGEVKALAIELPKERRGAVLKMEASEASAGQSKITVGRSEYTEDQTLDLEGAVRGAIRSAAERPGASDLASTVETIFRDGAQGRIVRANYRWAGIAEATHTIFIAKDRKLFQVVVLGPQSEVTELADRIFPSVRLLTPVAVANSLGAGTSDGWLWRKFSGITLELPGGIRPSAEDEPQTAGSELRKKVTSESKHGAVSILLSHETHARGDANVGIATDRFIEATRGLKSMKGFYDSVEKVFKEGTQARRISLGYTETDGTAMMMHLLYLAKAEHLWRVIVMGPPDEVEKLSKRIHDSVQLEVAAAEPEPPPAAKAPAPAQEPRMAPPPVTAPPSVTAPPAATAPPSAPWVPPVEGKKRYVAGISLWLPEGVTPKENEKVMPAESGYVKNVGCKVWWREVGIQIAHVEHAERVPNVDAAVKGMVEEYRERLGATDIKPHEIPIERDGVSGKIVVMTVNGLKVPTFGYAMIVTRGRHLWQVVAVGPNDETTKVAAHIVTSLDVDLLAVDGWKRREFSGISLDLPASVQPAERDETLEPGASLSKRVYSSHQFQDVTISLSHMAYVEGDVDVDVAVENNLKVTRDSPVVRDWSEEVSPLKCDGRPARLMRTTYTRENSGMATHGFFVAQRNHLWKVLLIGNPDDVSRLSERMLGSVRMVEGTGR